MQNQWSFTIEAISILNGGLQLQVNLPPKDSDLWNISTTGGENWIAIGMDLSGNASHFATWLSQFNIRGPANELQSQLNSTAKFVFPGAGTMLYKNPIYNNEHDLLVEAHYNGWVPLFSRAAKLLLTLSVLTTGATLQCYRLAWTRAGECQTPPPLLGVGDFRMSRLFSAGSWGRELIDDALIFICCGWAFVPVAVCRANPRLSSLQSAPTTFSSFPQDKIQQYYHFFAVPASLLATQHHLRGNGLPSPLLIRIRNDLSGYALVL